MFHNNIFPITCPYPNINRNEISKLTAEPKGGVKKSHTRISMPDKKKQPANDTAKANNKSEKDFDFKVGKTILHLTNQNKIYFPDDGITKGNIVNYYKEVGDLMLPYIKHRPQSMNRFPDGIKGPS